jgi:hypothetical protein
LVGEVDGRRIIIDPDDQRAVIIRFRGEPPIELSTYPSRSKPMSGQSEFRFEERVLRAKFQCARAEESLGDELSRARAVMALRPLLALRELKSLAATPSGIVARFDYGNPAYIPAAILRESLPLLTGLAALIEPSSAVDREPFESGTSDISK